MIESSHDPFRQQHKIVPAAQLTAIRERFRDKTIVLCHGAFDLVHMGHLIHFEEARSLGDMLVVTITADQYITKKRSVSFSEEYRARQLAALEIVDHVAIIDEPSAVTAIEALHPDVYVKGAEYAHLMLDKTANIFREKIWSSVTEAACISRGVRRSRRPSCRTSCWPRPRRRRATRCCATIACCSGICRSSASRSSS